MKRLFLNFIYFILIFKTYAAPQSPEINDQFEETNHTELLKTEDKDLEIQPIHTEIENQTSTEIQPKHTEIENPENQPTSTEMTTIEWTINDITNITYEPSEPSFMTKIYNIIALNILKFVTEPKVNVVFKNMGTCLVNGAMEIISFYFPAPLIPLIASAAGLIIPFEPVVMLKEKMPVTSYRRAFKRAVNGFLGTFDRYKYEEEDPYMTRRFNRRFLQKSKENENDS